jgi:drug/metabolite transporter (DMT)-like permease
MSTLGFGLVLAAAFCHAIWNVFVKRINGGPELVWLFSIISVAFYLPVAIAIAVTSTTSVFGPRELVFIGGSVVLHLGYFLLLQQGYRRGDLSLVYPTARATGPLLSTLVAVLVLGEHMSSQIAAGGIAIVVGVLFLTGGFKRGGNKLGASVAFGLGAGTLISSYTVWDAYTVSHLMVPPLLLDYASSVGRATLLAPVAARRKKAVWELWRQHRLGVLAIAVFNPLAYILVLYALTFTPVVYVAPTREMSVVITVTMGSVLLGEGDLRRRLWWAAVIMFGVALLATA